MWLRRLSGNVATRDANTRCLQGSGGLLTPALRPLRNTAPADRSMARRKLQIKYSLLLRCDRDSWGIYGTFAPSFLAFVFLQTTVRLFAGIA